MYMYNTITYGPHTNAFCKHMYSLGRRMSWFDGCKLHYSTRLYVIVKAGKECCRRGIMVRGKGSSGQQYSTNWSEMLCRSLSLPLSPFLSPSFSLSLSLSFSQHNYIRCSSLLCGQPWAHPVHLRSHQEQGHHL